MQNQKLTIFSLLFLSVIRLFGQSNGDGQSHGSVSLTVIYDQKIHEEQWDTLAQPQFWKKVVTTSEDTCFVNVASTRQVIGVLDFECWNKRSDEYKGKFRDSLRELHGLVNQEQIYVTSGKKDFYRLDEVLPSVGKGINIFVEEGVDPWYAQTILLIESPGRLEYSNVGAYGSFQLMKSVARSHGLTVNRKIDERKDFDKSAKCAASLIKNTCVPHAKAILDSFNIEFNESELWCRLFVLHVYHAGAANVKAVVEHINPTEGGMGLITKLWTTQYGAFRNASQNYTQVALACLLRFEEITRDSFVNDYRSSVQ